MDRFHIRKSIDQSIAFGASQVAERMLDYSLSGAFL